MVVDVVHPRHLHLVDPLGGERNPVERRNRLPRGLPRGRVRHPRRTWWCRRVIPMNWPRRIDRTQWHHLCQTHHLHILLIGGVVEAWASGRRKSHLHLSTISCPSISCPSPSWGSGPHPCCCHNPRWGRKGEGRRRRGRRGRKARRRRREGRRGRIGRRRGERRRKREGNTPRGHPLTKDTVSHNIAVSHAKPR